MNAVTIRIRKRRYDTLVNAIAALLASYDVAGPPSEAFDVETLAAVGSFDEFEILRDFAIRLGEADPVDTAGEDDGSESVSEENDSESGDEDAEYVEVDVHAHHLVAAVAAFPDLRGAADVPEAELLVVVQGLCYEYLVAVAGRSLRRDET
ncbi:MULTISPECIES: hypothetical protein [Halorussus]|uniref:hypothetical protein n=1 Tax=Halorussus TaxID=1070314 RepID=UPI0020A1BEEF|nr:hypothetical protein [Halorussus vallis]USZ77377.1 hypothetical protein NGM07_08600 [Halorussus vallis]